MGAKGTDVPQITKPLLTHANASDAPIDAMTRKRPVFCPCCSMLAQNDPYYYVLASRRRNHNHRGAVCHLSRQPDDSGRTRQPSGPQKGCDTTKSTTTSPPPPRAPHTLSLPNIHWNHLSSMLYRRSVLSSIFKESTEYISYDGVWSRLLGLDGRLGCHARVWQL